MDELQIFNNPEFGTLRSFTIDGEPWFVGIDIANALGYKKPQDAIVRHIDEDDSTFHGAVDSAGRNQQTKLINESGMYALIIMSELPSAKKFKRWVTKEVLPSILKTGSYNLPQFTTNELVLKIAQSNVELERKVKELKDSQSQLEQKVDTAVKIFATSDRSWKENMKMVINDLTEASGCASVSFLGKLYRELEAMALVNLQSRLARRRERMKKFGATYVEYMAVTKLDIISYDKRLRPIFEGIIRKYLAGILNSDM